MGRLEGDSTWDARLTPVSCRATIPPNGTYPLLRESDPAAEILWIGYQEEHIAARHGVSLEHFEEAWRGREDFGTGEDPKYGPYIESVGCTEDGRLVEMVWRWQDEDVWPITAYYVPPE